MSKTLYRLFIILWLVIFSYFEACRFLKSIEGLPGSGVGDKGDATSIKVLSENAVTTLKKTDKILFISDDGLAFMYFNLQAYPLIAKWSKSFDPIIYENYDYLILYKYSANVDLKNGIYNTHDFN